jgi:four helix bundle protein
MSSEVKNLKQRTHEFPLRVIRLVDTLPPKKSCNVIGNQLLRCATSVGANYRAACRARSPAEFIAKMGIVEEEADESIFWLEMLTDAGLIKPELVEGLKKEANEIVAMVVASIVTARRNQRVESPRKV